MELCWTVLVSISSDLFNVYAIKEYIDYSFSANVT